MSIEYIAVLILILFFIVGAWLQKNLNRMENKIDKLQREVESTRISLEHWKNYEERVGLKIRENE
tara:strand:- start:2964 stop:3158 length:195 start_codon:yes stop_codon:yes gene_type:complete